MSRSKDPFTAEFVFTSVSMAMLWHRRALGMFDVGFSFPLGSHVERKHARQPVVRPTTESTVGCGIYLHYPIISTTEADEITLLDRVASVASASLPLHRGHERSPHPPKKSTHRSAVGEVIPAADELQLWAGERCWWGGDRGGAARARPEALRAVQPCVSGAKVGGTGRLARCPHPPRQESRSQDVTPVGGGPMTSTHLRSELRGEKVRVQED